MSAIPLKADIRSALAHVRFVPIADIDELPQLLLLGSPQMAFHLAFSLANKLAL
jgi:hypothetical protein